MTGTLNEKLVDAGETVKLTASLTGINLKEGIVYSDCKIIVTDRKSQKSDSCNFKMGVEYESGLVCKPNNVYCIGDKTLRTCSKDGKSYTDKQCEEICSNSQCSSAGEKKVECGFFCQIGDFFTKLKLLFAIILGFIAGILGLSYMTELTKSSNNMWLRIILSISALLIFGFTVGILVWIFSNQLIFLIILIIVLIVLGIIRGFIKNQTENTMKKIK